jgi:GDP-D-mannose dehydratase
LESIEALKRPADLDYSSLDPSRICQDIGWSSSRTIQEIVGKMYSGELF